MCIGSSVTSAGALDDVLYYRAAVQLEDGRIAVGYFAFWSEERPLGKQLAHMERRTRAHPGPRLLPFPARRARPSALLSYGLGDVEGVSIVYTRQPDGTLRADEAFGDDRTERTVPISREQMFALDEKAPTFYTDIWSHQLAGRGAHSRRDLTYLRCYEGASIRPLPQSVSDAFRVEGRAGPAHVEQRVGKRLDVAEPSDALARAGIGE